MKIAFVLDEFTLGTAGQQLLDRYLIGFPRHGRFYRPDGWEVAVQVRGGAREALDQRVQDHPLRVVGGLPQLLEGANGVVVVSSERGELARRVVEGAPRSCRCFFYGALGEGEEARDLMSAAAARGVRVLAGTELPITWRLPALEVPKGLVLAEALTVVQGEWPGAEVDGLEGLLAMVEQRAGGEKGWRRIRALAGAEVWRARERKEWSRDLLSAALSRSDTPQGDPALDGRTQDLVGLGLVERLAKAPRGWLLEHGDGLRSAVLVLDGVVKDCTVAIRSQSGQVFATQLFRAPQPAAHHFSELAAALEPYFTEGKAPWPLERNLLEAAALGVMSGARNTSGWKETPELGISYG